MESIYDFVSKIEYYWADIENDLFKKIPSNRKLSKNEVREIIRRNKAITIPVLLMSNKSQRAITRHDDTVYYISSTDESAWLMYKNQHYKEYSWSSYKISFSDFVCQLEAQTKYKQVGLCILRQGEKYYFNLAELVKMELENRDELKKKILAEIQAYTGPVNEEYVIGIQNNLPLQSIQNRKTYVVVAENKSVMKHFTKYARPQFEYITNDLIAYITLKASGLHDLVMSSSIFAGIMIIDRNEEVHLVDKKYMSVFRKKQTTVSNTQQPASKNNTPVQSAQISSSPAKKTQITPDEQKKYQELKNISNKKNVWILYCNGEIVALKDMRNNDLITQTSSATRCLLMIAENDTLLQNIYQSFLPLTKLPIDKYSMKMIGCEEIIAFGKKKSLTLIYYINKFNEDYIFSYNEFAKIISNPQNAIEQLSPFEKVKLTPKDVGFKKVLPQTTNINTIDINTILKSEYTRLCEALFCSESPFNKNNKQDLISLAYTIDILKKNLSRKEYHNKIVNITTLCRLKMWDSVADCIARFAYEAMTIDASLKLTEAEKQEISVKRELIIKNKYEHKANSFGIVPPRAAPKWM